MNGCYLFIYLIGVLGRTRELLSIMAREKRPEPVRNQVAERLSHVRPERKPACS